MVGAQAVDSRTHHTDACWDVDGIYKHAKDVIGVNLIGSIYTHFHLDHAGNLRIPGLKDILSKGGTTWIGTQQLLF